MLRSVDPLAPAEGTHTKEATRAIQGTRIDKVQEMEEIGEMKMQNEKDHQTRT